MSLKTPTQMDYTAPYVLGQIRDFVFNDLSVDLETFFAKEFDNIADSEIAMNILFNNEAFVDMILSNDIYYSKVFKNSKMLSGMIPESLLFVKCLDNKSYLSRLLAIPEATTLIYADLAASEKIMCAITKTSMIIPSVRNTTIDPLVDTVGDAIDGVVRYKDNQSSRYLNALQAGSSGASAGITTTTTITLNLSNVNKLIWYTNFNAYYSLKEYTININGEQVLRKTIKEHGVTNDDMKEYTLDVKSFTGEVPIKFTITSFNDSGASKSRGVYIAINRLRLEV